MDGTSGRDGVAPSASDTRGSRLHVRRLHPSGPAPLRVLVVGDRSTTGGLADRVLDRVWLSTRRGVDLDVLGDLKPVLHAVDRTFEEWRLGRYEAVVLVVDERLESPLRVRTVHRLKEVLRQVLADTAGASRVIVAEAAAPQQEAGRHAGPVPSRVERTVRGLTASRVAFCAEAARPLAEAVCEEIRAGLGAAGTDTAARRRAVPDDEHARQQALDELGIVGVAPDPRLDDLVELARTAFGTECAEITVLDPDRQWKMAVAGSERRPNPRAHSFCTHAIERAEPTVIPDARLDPRVRDSPLAQGPDPVRFYAAHPLESPDGYRIGSFCIYDSEPRDPEEIDLQVLRDLALLAQAEITGVDAPPVGTAPLPSR
ncbi:MAG: GAF domain-containing protein [Amnibacterium sp.]